MVFLKRFFSFFEERFWLQGILGLGFLCAVYVPALFGHGFADPDAFYHAKISALLWQQGPIHFFSWLDLSLVGQHFADLHFLFHVLIAPLTALFGMMDGMRYGMIFLMGMFALIFAWCLRWLEIRFPWVWTILCVSLAPLLIRFSLGKASALALMWFVLGITASLKRWPWLLLFVVFGFSLSHGGWMILVGSVGILCLMRLLFEAQFEERVLPLWFRCKTEAPLIFASFIGALCGIAIHPNFPENIRFTWVQLVTIGLQTPTDRVLMGKEWMSPSPVQIVSALGPLLIVALLIGVGFVFAPKKKMNLMYVLPTLQLGSLLAVFVALMMLSIRSIEYVIPVFVLFLAFAAQSVSWKTMIEQQRTMLILGCVLCIFAQSVLLYKALIQLRDRSYPDELYRSAVQAMRQVGGKVGDRVFHLSFDRFPLLFAQDDGFRYVSGLDPTFLLVTEPELSDRMDAALRRPKETKSTDWQWMVSSTQARFVFVPKIGVFQPYLEVLDVEKGLYRAIFEDEKSKVYQVQK